MSEIGRDKMPNIFHASSQGRIKRGKRGQLSRPPPARGTPWWNLVVSH